MIDFELPEKITNELQMAKMVAESIMRQYSRYYDEHEHERPVEYINMMWPIMREQYKRRTEKLQVNGNGSSPAKKEGPDFSILRLILMIEMLSWGDAGQYLCTPDPAAGRRGLEAVGTKEQKIRILGKFGRGRAEVGRDGDDRAGRRFRHEQYQDNGRSRQRNQRMDTQRRENLLHQRLSGPG
jgi:acyl-CoA dehydrogenase